MAFSGQRIGFAVLRQSTHQTNHLTEHPTNYFYFHFIYCLFLYTSQPEDSVRGLAARHVLSSQSSSFLRHPRAQSLQHAEHPFKHHIPPSPPLTVTSKPGFKFHTFYVLSKRVSGMGGREVEEGGKRGVGGGAIVAVPLLLDDFYVF